MVKGIRLECQDGLAEEPRTNEEYKVGHDDEEDCKRCMQQFSIRMCVQKIARKLLVRDANE